MNGYLLILEIRQKITTSEIFMDAIIIWQLCHCSDSRDPTQTDVKTKAVNQVRLFTQSPWTSASQSSTLSSSYLVPQCCATLIVSAYYSYNPLNFF